MSLDHYSQLGWAMWRELNSPTPEPGDDDYEESPYVREPRPIVPSIVGNLTEEELRTLHRWHTRANLDDDEKARNCCQRANSLRAQARELDAGAVRHVSTAMQGRLWGTEGWHALIIATDSTYVVDGITKWVPKWKLRQ